MFTQCQGEAILPEKCSRGGRSGKEGELLEQQLEIKACHPGGVHLNSQVAEGSREMPAAWDGDQSQDHTLEHSEKRGFSGALHWKGSLLQIASI